MSEHDKSQSMVEGLRVGDRIHVQSGAGTVTVLQLGPIQPACDGCYASLRVLHTTGDAFFPFAEHQLYYQDDGRVQGWMMTSGQSYPNLAQAMKGFSQ